MIGHLLGLYEKNKNKSKNITCPHCHEKGYVKIKRVNVRRGISGGKAVGGLLTGGISLLLVGLSRMEEVTKAKCTNCNSAWQF